MLQEGMIAPHFTAVDGQGRNWTDEDFQGRKLILYFYPKDNTPG